MYRLEKVTKNYLKDDKTIDEISLMLPKTGFVTILGASGSGKTTLLNLLGGLDTISNGNIYVGEQNLAHFKEKDFNKLRFNHLGFVFQSYNLIPYLSVYDNLEINLLLGKTKDRRKRIEFLLNEFGLSLLKNRLVKTLSGGEKQRLAIARSVLNNPEIILADEPTGNLDSKNAEIVTNFLKRLSEKSLVIFVTHNEVLARDYSDEIITLSDGKVLSHEKLNAPENEKPFEFKKDEKPILRPLAVLKMIFGNIRVKWIRFVLTVLALAIGLGGVFLVVMVKTNVTNYQKELLKDNTFNYPISIGPEVLYENIVTTELNPLFPDDGHFFVTNPKYYSVHLYHFKESFFNMIDNLDKTKYKLIEYEKTLPFISITKAKDEYKRVYEHVFEEVSDETTKNGYDVLEGKIPNSKDEIAIIISQRNEISLSTLESLGYDLSVGKHNILSLVGKEISLISPDDFFFKEGVVFKEKDSSNYESLFLNPNLKLRVVGVLREKKTAKNLTHSNSFLYHKDLYSYVKTLNLNSKVAKAQINNPIDVFTNFEFKDIDSETRFITKEYQYESRLKQIGVLPTISRVRIYSNNFLDRIYLDKVLDEYIASEKNTNLSIWYYDDTKELVLEFNAFIGILIKSLAIFTFVCLLISFIMVGVLAYISVLEREKSLAILKTMGASKFDILRIVVFESSFTGFVSAILGIFFSFVFTNPVMKSIKKVLIQNDALSFNPDSIKFMPVPVQYVFLILLGASLLGALSAVIPALRASSQKPAKVLRRGE